MFCSARGISVRSKLGSMVAPSGKDLGRVGHCGTDAGVGATAADVAGHGSVDLGGRGLLALGQRVEEGRGTHDLAALAVAALRHIVFDPGGVNRSAHTVVAV